MADHHQQSSEAVATAAASPPKQIVDDSRASMEEILVELHAAPDVQLQLVNLLTGFGNHGGDTDAVVSRAAELLRAHPDALRMFTAFIYMDVPAEAEQILALTTTRPRRRRTSRGIRRERQRGTQQQQTTAAPEAQAALTFVKRVHETAGPVVHARFLAVLSEAKGSEDMAADEIYDRARRAFGPAHVGLLHEFATVWLPGEEVWNLQQQQARGPAALRRRSRAAATSSHAVAAAGMLPDAKKKPRAHDGDNGRRHDHVIAVLEVTNVKKRRCDDDGTARGLHAHHRIGESSGGGGAAPQVQGRDDDDYDYAPRSRAKKPHIGNGEFSGSVSSAARVLGADATGVHHAYSGDSDKKPPRRRAANGCKGPSAGTAAAGPPKQQQPERDGEVRRFRQEWEFQTNYSKLVATSDRVTELLRRPTRTRRHGDGADGGGNRSVEALFPLPECREFLRNCYGERWGRMRAALELGESRVPALEAIERRLTAKEDEAVAEESRKRCRHDPGRVAQRLHGFAMDCTRRLDEECRRRHHGGGA